MKTAAQENKYAGLDAYIASLPITYRAEFVPQSKSRNASEKNPSLNWKVSIARLTSLGLPAGKITTDYMQGIAHAPNYDLVPYTEKNRVYVHDYFKGVAESGKYNARIKKFSTGAIDAFETFTPNPFGLKPLPAPLLRDVLYSLVMDSDVLEYTGFEDWAPNLGYDTDSREAERIYSDCIAIALKLKSIIGQSAIEKLRELFSDY